MIESQRVLRNAVVDSLTLEGLFKKFAILPCRLLKMTALGPSCISYDISNFSSLIASSFSLPPALQSEYFIR